MLRRIFAVVGRLQSPLRQFVYDELPRDVLTRLESLRVDVNSMLDMDAREVGE